MGNLYKDFHTLMYVFKGLPAGGSRVLIEIRLISKKVSQAEPEYINMHPPPQLTL